MRKKMVLIGLLCLVVFVGIAMATYNITVYSESDATKELEKTGSPTITFTSCKLIEAKKTVETNLDIVQKPIIATGEIAYLKDGEQKIYNFTFEIKDKATVEKETEDACKAEQPKILDYFTAEQKVIIIDYKNEFSTVIASTYDLTTGTWKTK